MIECPKCHEKMTLVASVPAEQKMAMELKYDNEYLAAATLGGMITNTEQLLIAVAKEVGSDVSVFVSGIKYGYHKCRVEFVILARLPEPQEASK